MVKVRSSNLNESQKKCYIGNPKTEEGKKDQRKAGEKAWVRI